MKKVFLIALGCFAFSIMFSFQYEDSEINLNEVLAGGTCCPGSGVCIPGNGHVHNNHWWRSDGRPCDAGSGGSGGAGG
ncbi:hypothetical protein Q4Q34_03995 [Flavivirga abyssicola]|uniref:hypothetical protein n=1 Tax=Flavivirga abyssicola TaxID=3063533 RepID=UPI0026E113D7|nr:hypothetical protein [Flavivirga sp. MEBiC07777]WVK14191.1 hypothetical protein Q4Q34_03995 [Flavivirga sp. MEBiC07777]